MINEIFSTIGLGGLILLLGAIGGGLFSAWVTWRMLKENAARELLSESMEIQGMLEAYILDGPNYVNERFSENPQLTSDPKSNPKGLFLRKVEVRAVLDDAEWNLPENGISYYELPESRRTWIVRDRVMKPPLGSLGARTGDYHPALLTSKSFEELWAWIERVACARSGRLLTNIGLNLQRPLLGAVMGEDRITVINRTHLLSKRAKKLLKKCRDKYFSSSRTD